MLRRTAIMLVSLVMLLTLDAAAQEDRSEISLQGTGVFTRDTNGNGISRAATDTGAFLYGAGADYGLTRHFSLRAEYRGFVYKNPDFGLAALNTDSWTHTAQPSAGIVFRF